MLKPNQYSTIRGEPKHKPAEGVSAFYEALLKPNTLLLTVSGYVALVLKDNIVKYFSDAFAGEQKAILVLSLLTVSIAGTLRAYQSLFLAKRDYPDLEYGWKHILTFGAILVFTISPALLDQNPMWLMIVFALCAALGTKNFFGLYQRDIPARSEKYDYPIERRIQLFNTIAFAILTLDLCLGAYSLYAAPTPTLITYLTIGLAVVLLLFNMAHSGQLSFLPKFLFKNDPDKPSQRIEHYRKLFWRASTGLTDQEVLAKIKGVSEKEFRPIKTARARLNQVDLIVSHLCIEFGYVYEYVFASNDPEETKKVLTWLVTSGSGLGPLGYQNFYILRSDEKNLGFFRIDTSHDVWIYDILASLSLSIKFVREFGVKRVLKIRQRLRALQRTQPAPDPKELRLTYIVVFPEYRRQGIGEISLDLLVAALLRTVTNDIIVDKMSLFVREKNVGALQLFKKLGFTENRDVRWDDIDPLQGDERVGRALYMECAKIA